VNYSITSDKEIRFTITIVALQIINFIYQNNKRNVIQTQIFILISGEVNNSNI